jgi:hypothetical protein
MPLRIPEERERGEYLYFCTSKGVSICTFVLVKTTSSCIGSRRCRCAYLNQYAEGNKGCAYFCMCIRGSRRCR